MDKILIRGGTPLQGEITMSGAKNAVLPILFASLLTDENCVYKNVPDLKDVSTTVKLLENFGVSTKKDENTLHVLAHNIEKPLASYDLVKTMRASVLALGPLLARHGYARIALPGGCAIGARPINLHLNALVSLGADISLNEGYVTAQAKKLKGTTLCFETTTVTGTENIMMAAVLAEGTTIIENAAKEPEIIDLAQCLNKMGAKIEGTGTSRITIEGVSDLKGVEYEIMPDRIETGTYLVAVAATGGEVVLHNGEAKHLQSILTKLTQMGVDLDLSVKNQIKIKSEGKLKSVNIKTEPYPGFPTDMQAQMMALASISEGTSFIAEHIFENRFMHVCELQRMGAEIDIHGNVAQVKGVSHLKGAPVMATDLRASVSLVIAGLVAEGTTEIHRVYHLDRGYEALERKLSQLGAHIERVS
ncbi:MAG: UDP-N-acetylglucosamine 1-carboxyvinyltransferase [Deltaproteobacteria bacterium]|nr:UDP-N-acetylglucosamine 1-carboxyvinyltransferase [Deltaproteobacteria bacterium]